MEKVIAEDIKKANREDMTMEAVEAIEAIENAQINWEGVDWTMDYKGIVADSSDEVKSALKEFKSSGAEPSYKFDQDYNPWLDPDVLKEALEYMKNFEEEAAVDAKEAKDLGGEAIAAIEEGDVEAALEAIDEADSIENQYGDSPSYGPALEAVKRWAKKESGNDTV